MVGKQTIGPEGEEGPDERVREQYASLWQAGNGKEEKEVTTKNVFTPEEEQIIIAYVKNHLYDDKDKIDWKLVDKTITIMSELARRESGERVERRANELWNVYRKGIISTSTDNWEDLPHLTKQGFRALARHDLERDGQVIKEPDIEELARKARIAYSDVDVYPWENLESSIKNKWIRAVEAVVKDVLEQ